MFFSLAIFILTMATLLLADCRSKEERLIIGEWKLTDIKRTLDSTLVAPNPWGDYLHDESKSLMLIFKKNEWFELIKKDGSDSHIETGAYVIKNDGTWLIFMYWENRNEMWYSGVFYDIILGKQELIFKSAVYSQNTTDFFNPPDYYTHIFKKIK